MLTSEFLFALCQRGAEPALKREVTLARPDLRAGYQRPGVVTFRCDRSLPVDHHLESVLARVAGLSLGTVPDVAAAAAKVAALEEKPARLHVIERDLFRPDEVPPAHPLGALAKETEAALRAALPGAFPDDATAKTGDLVLDVIVAPGDPILLGVHRHAEGRSPHPGGRYVYEVPAEAPSRAYRKTEEAIAAFELPVRAGDVAVELGAAPGGGVLALLRRGVTVFAVDPAALDERVLAFAGPGGAKAVALKKTMDAVERADLTAPVQWLLMDVNLAPQVALRQAARVASLCKGSLLGVVLTLKLNDWKFLDQLESFLATARDMGIVGPDARQLPAHRQEIVLAGLTAKGRLRIPGPG